MDNSPMSPADFAAMTNSDGLGGNNWFAMIILFALIFGFNGNGFGGGMNGQGGYATNASVQQGFDMQNTLANQRELLAATNQTFHDTMGVIQNVYGEVQRDIAGLAVGQANLLAKQNECCASTQLQIMQGSSALAAQIAQNEYNNAMRDAATNAHFTAEIQGVKDMIYGDKIAELQQEVSQLRGALGNQGIQSQLEAIQQNMVTYPRQMTYNAGPSPFCGCGFGCGYNV